MLTCTFFASTKDFLISACFLLWSAFSFAFCFASASDVVYAKGQFSGSSTGRFERFEKLMNEDCKKAAVEALAGVNNIGDFLFFHWANGAFGYFPSYVLGSAMAAQIYSYMEKHLPVKELLQTGDLKPIREFLAKHIHQYGAMRPMNRLLNDMMGEGLNVDYYIQSNERWL